MPRRYLWFVLVALAAIVTFVQLGLWQLDRLGERRAANEAMVARRTQPEETVASLSSDTASARFRAVRVVGRFDYDNQFVWTARTRDGAPGVVFLTPIVVDSGPAVVVNRGWAYSADGSSINDSLWRETERDTVVGYAEVYTSGTGPVFVGTLPRRIRRLALDSLRAKLPYDVAPILVVQQRGAGHQAEVKHPFRVSLPPLDEGPHRGYALQWFAFALITVVGTVAAVQRGRREPNDRPR